MDLYMYMDLYLFMFMYMYNYMFMYMDINMDICLYIVCNVHNVFLCCISIWGCILYVPFYTLYILCIYCNYIACTEYSSDPSIY